MFCLTKRARVTGGERNAAGTYRRIMQRRDLLSNENEHKKEPPLKSLFGREPQLTYAIRGGAAGAGIAA
jgi:hypothetical protein